MTFSRTWILAGLCLLPIFAHGTGALLCGKGGNVYEPAEKAIILYDQGREDLVLQARFEGANQQFGWLLPMPNLPEIREGSMDCFYELSARTRHFIAEHDDGIGYETHTTSTFSSAMISSVIKIKTVGAFDVSILPAGDLAAMTHWLRENNFLLPKEKLHVLDSYVKNHWYFVRSKLTPPEAVSIWKPGEPIRSQLVRQKPNRSPKELARAN